MTTPPPTPPTPAKLYTLTHDDAIAFFSALALTFVVARGLGELATRLKQPAVLGELIAGILLGKTVLGTANPALFTYLYGPSRTGLAFQGVTQLIVTFFMFVAGLEMRLSLVAQRGRATAGVGLFSMLVPLLLGFGACVANPALFAMPTTAPSAYSYALFVGTAMSITAVPVAAKTLRDLHLYRTDMGTIVMGSAISNDVAGWCLFAVVLSISSASAWSNSPGLVAGIILSVVYVVFMLTLARTLVNRLLPFIHAYTSFPAMPFGFMGIFTLASAAFALYLGLHNSLGGFLAGIVIGNAPNAKPSLKKDIDTFVTHVLSPIFFGAVCLQANFVTGFDPAVAFLVLFIGCLGKLVGGFVGARVGKCTLRESFAIAVCMNSRGAMELILANVALSTNLISQVMFVALVLLAIITSLMPGPLLRRIMVVRETVPLTRFVAPHGLVRDLKAPDASAAITQLCVAAGHPQAASSVVMNEAMVPTGHPDQIAVPHARVEGLRAPLIVVGVAPHGVDFHSPDTSLAHTIVLLLVPTPDVALEQELIARLTALFSHEAFREDVAHAKSRVELLALMALEAHATGDVPAGPHTEDEERAVARARGSTASGGNHDSGQSDAGQQHAAVNSTAAGAASPLARPLAEPVSSTVAGPGRDLDLA